MAGTSYIRWDDDDVHFVPDQHSELNLYSASSLKQQSAGKHVSPLRHIIVIPSQPVLSLSLLCCILGEEATITNFIVFGLIQSGLKPTMYHAWSELVYHHTTYAVLIGFI